MPAFSPYDFFLLRRPLKPVDALLAFHHRATEGGREAFKAGIRQAFSAPELQEAIYIASPDLHAELLRWLAGEKTDLREEDKLLLTLYKYYLRTSTRATPYGLFAGCTPGAVGEEPTDIRFSSPGAAGGAYKHCRLDMNYVAEIVAYLLRDPVIRHQATFRPNNSLYKVGNSYRYVEFFLKNKRRSYFLSGLGSSAYVEKVLAFTREGKRLPEIAGLLVAEGLGAEPEALHFAEQLVDAQLLVSDLEPTLTGDEFFRVLHGKLAAYRGAERYVRVFEEITVLLGRQDFSVAHYEAVRHLINRELVRTGSKDLVQTDLFFTPARNVLGKGVLTGLLDTLEDLHWLNRTETNPQLESFITRFKARYEAQEVPLSVALDSEAGVGYGLHVNGIADYMPLLQGIAFPGEPAAASVPWTPRTRLRHALLLRARAGRLQEVQLEESDIAPLRETGAPLPDGAYLAGSFLAQSQEHLDRGEYRFLFSALAGPSSANLLTRFGHGSPELTRHLEACIREEESRRPEAVYAEIVHLPKARVGNILMRPHLRKYEIPYLGQSSLPDEAQIPVEDLRVSIRENKVFLRSARLDRQVIPRLTTAHNYAKGLPVYKFLADLQSQEQVYHWSWSWYPFEQEVFLPRVVYKNVILSRARWFLRQADYPQLKNRQPDLAAFFGQLREKWQMPRLVVVQDGDHELLVDFTVPQSLELLARELREGDVVLYEFLATPDQCPLGDEQGRYTNEMVIPLRAARQPRRPILPAPARETAAPRSFMPGSEWLFVKVYAGNKTIGKLLTDTLWPLTRQLLAENRIDQWFFIRYHDPERHLVLRFHHASRPDFWRDVLAQLHGALAPLLAQGLITKVTTDTYQRELERYGAVGIELTEQLFCSDSIAVAEFLTRLDGDRGERYRWLFALRGVDMLLDDFGYALADKHQLLEALQRMFYQEQPPHSEARLRHAINDKYRQEGAAIGEILDPDRDPAALLAAVACFRRRSERNRPLVARMRAALPPGTTFNSVVPSFVHMFLNRLFVAKPRLHELVIYHFLSKYYKSQLARREQANRQAPAAQPYC